VQVSHDGTDGFVRSKSGRMILDAAGSNRVVALNNSASYAYVHCAGLDGGAFSVLLHATSFAGGGVWCVINTAFSSWLPLVCSKVIVGASGLSTSATIGAAADKVIELCDGTGSGGRATLRSVPLAVSVTADQNDWNPGTAMHLDVTTDSTSRTVTGLVAGVDGQIVWVRHVAGSGDLILAHESASSTAANRFDNETSASITVPIKARVQLVYSAGQSRWLAFPSETCT